MDFHNAKFIVSVGFGDGLPDIAGREIAFSGRSNVGKSSLINKLCNRKALAKVSGTPGKTTTVNFFSAGTGIYLADLPGYGYAKRPDSEKKRWAKLMERYFSSGRNIALVVQLLDIRHDPSEDDRIMLDFLMRTNTPFFAVLTKKDKLTGARQKESLAAFEYLLKPYRPLAVIPFSVLDNQSAPQLREAIERIAEGADQKTFTE